MDFKYRIRQLRTEEGLSHTQLASEFYKTEAAVRAWESGRTKPDADTLIQLSDYFDCSTDFLLGISDYKNINTFEAIKKSEAKTSNQISQLPPRIKTTVLAIMNDLVRGYEYVSKDEVLAMTVVEETLKIMDIIFEHCENAFAILNSGYDSFDEEDIPSIKTAIVDKAAYDGTQLRSICDGLITALKKAMLRELPGYDPEAETNELAKLRETIITSPTRPTFTSEDDDNAET